MKLMDHVVLKQLKEIKYDLSSSMPDNVKDELIEVLASRSLLSNEAIEIILKQYSYLIENSPYQCLDETVNPNSLFEDSISENFLASLIDGVRYHVNIPNIILRRVILDFRFIAKHYQNRDREQLWKTLDASSYSKWVDDDCNPNLDNFFMYHTNSF